jgi:hypothetical protein
MRTEWGRFTVAELKKAQAEGMGTRELARRFGKSRTVIMRLLGKDDGFRFDAEPRLEVMMDTAAFLGREAPTKAECTQTRARFEKYRTAI